MSQATRTDPAPGLVLLGCGHSQQIAALHSRGAATLAAALKLQLNATLDTDPSRLGTLSSGSLNPLAVDAGMALADGSHWAEWLGAWRQSCLLLLDHEQLASGAPAAATALLRQWQVPLLGLVQWGGPWDGVARRRDRLPWLGWLDAQGSGDAAAQLALAAALQSARQQAELA